jgi:hypothetical protein
VTQYVTKTVRFETQLYASSKIEIYKQLAVPIYYSRINVPILASCADPRILAGKPVVKGTRIAGDLVLEELGKNPAVDEL